MESYTLGDSRIWQYEGEESTKGPCETLISSATKPVVVDVLVRSIIGRDSVYNVQLTVGPSEMVCELTVKSKSNIEAARVLP